MQTLISVFLISLFSSYLNRLNALLHPHDFSYQKNSIYNLAAIAGSDKGTVNSRKNLFFNIVETGLKDKYKVEDIQRILKFCQYTKKEIPLPKTDPKNLYEPCEEYIDGLTAKPWWNKNEFSWSKDLEQLSNEFKKELEKFEVDQIFKSDSRYAQTMGVGWTAFRLQRFGAWIEDNCALFPKTTSLLKSLPIPYASRGIMFAKQKPYSGVSPHSDGRNFILTGHLGLKVPLEYEKCRIKVGGESRYWKQNELIIFDTSFVHETMNDTNEDRYVMILDFWHPELTQTERDCLQYIYDARNKFDSDKMYEIESSYVTKLLEQERIKKESKGIFDNFMSLFK